MSLKHKLCKQFCQSYTSTKIEQLRHLPSSKSRSSSQSSSIFAANNNTSLNINASSVGSQALQVNQSESQSNCTSNTSLNNQNNQNTVNSYKQIQTQTEESEILKNLLPICVNGTVIHGFGRGSKELGIKTANYSEQIVDNLPDNFETGIYYCWAQVVYEKESVSSDLQQDNIKSSSGLNMTQNQKNVNNRSAFSGNESGEGSSGQKGNRIKYTKVLPAVMSVGWNPYYKNTKKSMETHVIREFKEDWYNNQLRLMIVGRIRGERNFSSLDALIDAIYKDIDDAQSLLESDWSTACRGQDFFIEE